MHYPEEVWNNSALMNSEMAYYRLPHTIITVLLTCIGCFGNITVIVLFQRLNDPAKRDRFFIYALAWADLIALFHMVASTTLENTFSFVYFNDYLCRYWVFNSLMTADVSVYLLLIIAYHRYRLICLSTRSQMNLRGKRVAVLSAFICGFFTSLPLIFVSGCSNRDLFLSDRNVTAAPCRAYYTPFSIGYFSFLFCIHSLALSLVVVYFVKVGKVLFRKTKISLRRLRLNTVSIEEPETSSTGQTRVATNGITEDISKSFPQPQESEKKTESFLRSTSSRTSTVRRKRNAFKKDCRTNFTLMFIAIFILNVLGNTPQAVVRTLSFFDGGFMFRQNEMALCIFLLFERSSVFVHTIDPYIFAYFDMELRRQARLLFCRNCP